YRPEMTQSIKEYSRLLIRYLNKKKSYHYFIDRFGKIYRLIREDHAAFHSGNSIWADDEFLYLDLNHAFIGVCFEGKDFETNKPSDTAMKKENQQAIVPMEQSSINEAQLISGKELTDWLRVKYKIPQNNCVPHGLASVNPYDRLIGHHLDLSHGFPFDFFEIRNKYEEPIPAITEFGFTYDNYFVEIFNGKLWPGIAASEKIIIECAKEKRMSVTDYRKMLNGKFKQIFAQMKNKTAVRNEVLSKVDQPGT
ncbi:MAG: N-acetylmuramoyl-L-alanine amidase, partial [Deltaproteobacteria bacterium]